MQKRRIKSQRDNRTDSGYDTLDVRASEVLSGVKYDWMQVAIHVTASGRELRINNGPEKMIDLVKARVDNAKDTAANQMSVDLFSDGALPNQIGGLASIVSSNGTGTVGGINSANYPVWQNQVREMSGTNTWSKATIRGEMNALWLKTVNGGDKPDLIVLTHDLYSAFEESMQDNQRYTTSASADAGFGELMYKGAAVVFDDNANFGTTSETGYFLNTKYLYLVQHVDAQWSRDDEKTPINQDAVVIPLYWMGNLVCTKRRAQGKLIDAA